MDISPLPWFDDGYRVYAATPDDDKRNGHIIFDYKQIENANPADYAFIMKCVSMHAHLVKALNTAIWMLERDYIDNQKRGVIEKCRSVYSEAKGDA